MIDRYRSLLESNGGTIHRLEDWGRRQLAFIIKKVYKAHYVLMNIECNEATLSELSSMFKFSDAVIRELVIRKSKAVTESSPLARSKEKESEQAGSSIADREVAANDDPDKSDTTDSKIQPASVSPGSAAPVGQTEQIKDSSPEDSESEVEKADESDTLRKSEDDS